MNLQKLIEARELATPISHVFTADDTDPAMVVQYVPLNGTGATAATVAVTTATDITFTAAGAAPAGADAIGTAGVVDFATYTTLGALRDYIHNRGPWRCYLQGALRADASAAKLLTASAVSCIGANGATIYHDTSSTDFVSVAISGEKFTSNGKGGYNSDAEDFCENYLLRFAINADTAGGSTVKLYSASQLAETLMATYTLTDVTELEKVVNLMNPYAVAKRGQRLIVRAAAVTTLTLATAGSKFEVLGRTAVTRGNRIVDSKNY